MAKEETNVLWVDTKRKETDGAEEILPKKASVTEWKLPPDDSDDVDKMLCCSSLPAAAVEDGVWWMCC